MSQKQAISKGLSHFTPHTLRCTSRLTVEVVAEATKSLSHRRTESWHTKSSKRVATRRTEQALQQCWIHTRHSYLWHSRQSWHSWQAWHSTWSLAEHLSQQSRIQCRPATRHTRHAWHTRHTREAGQAWH